jgi:leucyl-tRNA synthetase
LDSDGQPTGRVVPVPDEQLPVDLPQLDDYQPHGRPEPLLAKAPDSWQIVELDGKRYRRELNTMPQWAGSCWYYLRFIDPKNDTCFVDPEKEKAWMPVDLYVGGAEHAVLHLLYARFWHKVLYDRGLVSTPEPFQRLVNQGMILGQVEYTALRRPDGSWVSFELGRRDSESGSWLGPDGQPLEAVHPSETEVTKSGDHFVLKDTADIRVDSRAHKMSKSRGNVVNPDDIVREYGADSLRLYEMFMGPLEATKPWSMQGVGGVRNFLDRCWRLLIDDRAEQVQLSAAVADVAPDAEQNRVIHSTLAAVTNSLEQLSFNTAIARLMECVNFFTKQTVRPKKSMETLVVMISPMAPHLAEELWQALGHSTSCALERWPEVDTEAIRSDTIVVPIQVNGKLRGKVTVAAEADRQTLEKAALEHEKVVEVLADSQLVKTVVVPGRLVNFVVRPRG